MLPEFPDERAFRDMWIAPFLAKIGYVLVKNTHGSGEQGKDFFFSDYDRFGHPRVYSAQVKNGNIGSGPREIGDLLDQVERSFTVRLRFHKGAHEQRIAAVYVMASGTISLPARERIHDWCVGKSFGENVFFLDGEQLENKERFATLESDEAALKMLFALKRELFRNAQVIKASNDIAKVGKFFSPVLRLRSIEEVLQHGVIPDEDAMTKLDQYWQVYASLSKFTEPNHHQEEELEGLKKTFHSAMRSAFEVEDVVDAEIERLQQRLTLTATVVDQKPDA